MDKKRVFVDMDGVLAVFKKTATLEELYEPGYFLGLQPMGNVVEAVRQLATMGDTEVYVLSSVLSDSFYAIGEKNEWLNKYLPEVDWEHRIFPSCGKDKKDFVPGGVRESDILLDDYTHNLLAWDPPGRGLKLLNGINHTNGTWDKECTHYSHRPQNIARAITEHGFTQNSQGLLQQDKDR